MAVRFIAPDPVPEGVGWRYSGTLKDEAGVVIPAAAFTALTVKIYVRDTLTDIQTMTTILNAGRGALHATSGLLTVTFLPADSDMVDAAAIEEWHIALIEGDYSGTRKFAREIWWRVVNYQKRP